MSLPSPSQGQCQIMFPDGLEHACGASQHIPFNQDLSSTHGVLLASLLGGLTLLGPSKRNAPKTGQARFVVGIQKSLDRIPETASVGHLARAGRLARASALLLMQIAL